MATVDLDDTRLHTGASGSGPLALLVHGFPLDSELWLDQLAGLADLRHVVAPDLRGFGRSAPTTLPVLAMEQHADDLVALLDALGEEQADVAALSMGGYVALAMWERHPERVRSLALLDTRASADPPQGRAGRDTMIQQVLEAGREWLAGRSRETLLPPDADPSVIARLRSMVEGTRYETIVAALRGMRDRPDRRELLGTITVPTLVVVGSEDVLTPPSDAEELAAAIPGARLAVIEGAGHLAPIERPDEVNALLRDHWTDDG